MGLRMGNASHLEADRNHHRRQAKDDEQRRANGPDVVMTRSRAGRTSSAADADAEMPAIDFPPCSRMTASSAHSSLAAGHAGCTGISYNVESG